MFFHSVEGDVRDLAFLQGEALAFLVALNFMRAQVRSSRYLRACSVLGLLADKIVRFCVKAHRDGRALPLQTCTLPSDDLASLMIISMERMNRSDAMAHPMGIPSSRSCQFDV